MLPAHSCNFATKVATPSWQLTGRHPNMSSFSLKMSPEKCELEMFTLGDQPKIHITSLNCCSA